MHHRDENVGEYEARYARLQRSRPEEILRKFNQYREMKYPHKSYPRTYWDRDGNQAYLDLIEAVQAYQSSNPSWQNIEWSKVAERYPHTLGDIARNLGTTNALKHKWNHIAEVTGIKSRAGAYRERSRSRESAFLDDAPVAENYIDTPVRITARTPLSGIAHGISINSPFYNIKSAPRTIAQPLLSDTSRLPAEPPHEAKLAELSPMGKPERFLIEQLRTVSVQRLIERVLQRGALRKWIEPQFCDGTGSALSEMVECMKNKHRDESSLLLIDFEELLDFMPLVQLVVESEGFGPDRATPEQRRAFLESSWTRFTHALLAFGSNQMGVT
jgi:hypothetical protein